MYIKRYTITSLILIALVGWYVYAYVTQETIGIELFGVLLPSLSVAIWVVIPLFVLYIASVMHMSFYSMLGNFRIRKYDKDMTKLLMLLLMLISIKQREIILLKHQDIKF